LCADAVLCVATRVERSQFSSLAIISTQTNLIFAPLPQGFTHPMPPKQHFSDGHELTVCKDARYLLVIQ